MIMKRAIVIVAGFGLVAAISGCNYEENKIVYKGEEMTVSDAEEKIADELEVENSDLDLEIDISEESDD